MKLVNFLNVTSDNTKVTMYKYMLENNEGYKLIVNNILLYSLLYCEEFTQYHNDTINFINIDGKDEVRIFLNATNKKEVL